MLLAILGAVVIGLSLGLFGSGGSILTVPVLMYLVDMPAGESIASSLLIVAGISLFGSISYIRRKNVSWRHFWVFGIPGMVGTYGGAWLGTLVDSRWQLLTFSLLMIVAAGLMWRSKPKPPAHVYSMNYAKVTLEGFVVGIITGFVGVGGGFLIVPALVLLAGLSMPVAIGTSLLIIVIKSIAGFFKYYAVMSSNDVQFDWLIIGIMILGGVFGSVFGSKIGRSLPKERLQKGFAVFLVLMGIFVIVKSVI
ncbi:sulfite exporter TauE/SafE family protein [Idiomarina abyssalis]|uniref:Probable membrane transporter protein n=1 Tax=Idiomarina abyssalis TaxID=86102 RepID=A0A8I1KHD2_9GAMM|nr:sulfite exporter TauE/SafE family protein [Idiomarina abyssalis]MBJ7266737.1 sulfite exporter TauE/SafE family protein [Idiomarina abyssalis]MBJ7272996.1 sulfite exporter TauE/SafE family protein [Idiomarina abyssalis]MBJ7315660.1 sulfite exporter TauE/SafE family protein [Idiomarina abyssalis]